MPAPIEIICGAAPAVSLKNLNGGGDKSRRLRAMQLQDACAPAQRANGGIWPARAAPPVDSTALPRTLLPLMRRRPPGQIAGAGLSAAPSDFSGLFDRFWLSEDLADVDLVLLRAEPPAGSGGCSGGSDGHGASDWAVGYLHCRAMRHPARHQAATPAVPALRHRRPRRCAQRAGPRVP